MKKLVLLSLLLFPLWANAVNQTGLITGYTAHERHGKRMVMFKLENAVTGGCNVTGRFALNEDRLSYDAIVSSVIAAFHAQTPVKVVYDETCNVFSNAFDARLVCVGDIPC